MHPTVPSARIPAVGLRALPALLLLVCLAALPARAQQVVLGWKWIEGDERRYVIESQLTQTIATEGRRGANEQRGRLVKATQIFHVLERVAEVTDGGVATVTRRFERVQVRGTDDGPDGVDTFDYDSALRTPPGRPGVRPTASDDKDHPMVAPYAALAGRTITFRIGPEGRVLGCTGADEALEGVFSPLEGDSAFNPAAMLFRAAVSNESMARELESALGLIPNRAVRRGEEWTFAFEQTLPLVGDLRTENVCRLTGVRGRPGAQIASISNKGGMTLEGGPAGIQSLGGLFRVDLGMSELSGTTEFDAAGGHIISQQQRMVSEWEAYAPDFADLDRLGESVKTTHRIEQDVRMSLER